MKKANKVLRPWTAIETIEKENSVTLNLLNREYRFEKSALLSKIVSNGIDVLASPIRVRGLENGEPIKIMEQGCNVLHSDNACVVLNGYIQTQVLAINITTTVEYDGLATVDFKVMPLGDGEIKIADETSKDFYLQMPITVTDKSGKGHYIENLAIEVPLNPEITDLYHYFSWSFMEDGEYDRIATSGALPEKFNEDFKPVFWIGNDLAGLTVCAESDKDRSFDEKHGIEVEKKANETVMRINLSKFNRWFTNYVSPKHRSIDDELVPLMYRFSFQATPVKPVDRAITDDKILHTDSAYRGNKGYSSYFLTPTIENPDELEIDRFKRLGVNLIVLHEKWNSIQNHWDTNNEERLANKKLVYEAHKRGIRVIPYFGYEISTAAPEFYDEYENVRMEIKGNPAWYRQPAQRPVSVCYNSSWQKVWLENVKRTVEEYDFDGVYLDSTILPDHCSNERHGCGYRDKDGNLHPTYPIYALREMFRDLYEFVDARDGIVFAHNAWMVASPILSYTHLYLSGEDLRYPCYKDLAKGIPMDYAKAHYTPQNIGVSGRLLVIEHPDVPTWNVKNGITLSLTHGVYTHCWGFNQIEPLAEVWNILDNFGLKEAEFSLYWRSGIKTSAEHLVCSYYKNKTVLDKDRYLLILANLSGTDENNAEFDFGEIELNEYNIIDAKTKKLILAEKNCIIADIESYGHRLVVLEPKIEV